MGAHRNYLLTHILGHSSDGYEDKMEELERNLYRYVWKCPIDIFVIGALSLRFKSGYQFTLEEFKEEFKSLLEDVSGFELTFKDEDWKNFYIDKTRWGDRIKGTDKSYMSEFFEF
jgi:hypothetical protein